MSNSTVFADSSEPVAQVFNLMSTFGAVMVGSFLSSILWGVSTFQVYLYFMKYYDSDSWQMKALIAFLWACDTANEVLIIKANFRVPILNWGDVAGINKQQLELMDHTVTEALVIILVQGWFIRRIYLFNKDRWFMALVMFILSCWLMIGTIVYLAFGYGRLITTLSTQREVILNMTLRAAAVVVDIAIAVNMIYLLRAQNSMLFKSSRRMVNRILLLSVNSSFITAIFATATLILLASQPQNLYYCIPELSLCSIYFSSLLANLNARNYIRGEEHTINTFSSINFHTNPISLQSLPRQHSTIGGSMTQGTKVSDMVVNIDTNTVIKSDRSDGTTFDQEDSFTASTKHEMV
ncbi:hypothetical protein EV361DRAFT_116105 [Lentinula raphanica]|nr:hypothetical protein FB446DRAFT_720116 [Lentinula raphanica]KAJ3825477.1 hypothetical protein F5880DRAFT_1700766 [Lentinula raphanica]KAJ3972755.1 hypothetical protein EV361DRAFT_116105 [Lentinula raphanica]